MVLDRQNGTSPPKQLLLALKHNVVLKYIKIYLLKVPQWYSIL
jgi:hypothetical protein